MRDHDDDEAPVVAGPTSEPANDSDLDAAADALRRQQIRERMLGMWRSAVAAVGEAVEAEKERQRDEAAPAAPAWNVGRRAAS